MNQQQQQEPTSQVVVHKYRYDGEEWVSGGSAPSIRPSSRESFESLETQSSPFYSVDDDNTPSSWWDEYDTVSTTSQYNEEDVDELLMQHFFNDLLPTHFVGSIVDDGKPKEYYQHGWLGSKRSRKDAGLGVGYVGSGEGFFIVCPSAAGSLVKPMYVEGVFCLVGPVLM